jgi:hypothetical protein
MKCFWLLVGGLAISLPFVASGQTNRSRPPTPPRMPPASMGQSRPPVMRAPAVRPPVVRPPTHQQPPARPIVVVPQQRSKKAGPLPPVVVKGKTAPNHPHNPSKMPGTSTSGKHPVSTAKKEAREHRLHPGERASVTQIAFKEHLDFEARNKLHAHHHFHHDRERSFLSRTARHHHHFDASRAWVMNVNWNPAFFRQPIQQQLQELDALASERAALRRWERRLAAEEDSLARLAWIRFTERWWHRHGHYHHLSPQERLARLLWELRRSQLVLLNDLAQEVRLTKAILASLTR